MKGVSRDTEKIAKFDSLSFVHSRLLSYSPHRENQEGINAITQGMEDIREELGISYREYPVQIVESAGLMVRIFSLFHGMDHSFIHSLR